MPKISIILTSHNRPKYLRQAIESILAQTERDFELLAIDDCSTDPGVEKVLDWASRDRRVIVFGTSHNINNLPVVWNRGLDVARGKYICLLDDDNKRKPDYLEKMSLWLDGNPDFYAVACFAEILQGEELTAIFDMPAKMTKENIKTDNHVDSGCMMFRKSVIDEIGWFDERLRSCDDWDFVKRIVLQTDRGFGIIPEPLAIYRWHDRNRSYIRDSLGDVKNRNFIVHKKNYNRVWDILVFHQDKDKITLSQNNVLEGVCSALEDLPFTRITRLSLSKLERWGIERLHDIVFNFAPFSIDLKAMERLSRHGRHEVVNFHIEDPQALGDNLERAGFATYIFSNDISVVERYEQVVGAGKCGFCPSVSYDDINLKTGVRRKKRLGVVFYGHGYESRKEFVRELEPRLKKAGHPLTVIGGDWDSRKASYTGELSQARSLEMLAQSKIVILRSREKTDLGGERDSITPQSVTRGYLEAGSGSLVMLDSAREHHSFDGEVVFYKGMDDLVEKINHYMRNDRERERIGRRARQRALTDFSYRARMRHLVNAVRSQRFHVEIR